MRWPAALFVIVLATHAILTFVNLRSGWLVGLEFRQTQTAISCLFIQSEHNFSLAYPTPVLGKPWSIPMEFPLYEWSVVGLSNGTGWSLAVCGRLVSIACFYATLPALFRILGRLGLARPRRLLAVTLVLSSPIYIFYSRAFLIESMALAFSAWFLAAFVQTMDRRKPAWLLVAVVAGAGAALVKVTTFIVWCLPAAAYGAWLLVRDLRISRNSAQLTLAWGLATVLPAVAVGWWWVRFSDAVKRLNPAGIDLVSSRLTTFNFGTWSDRFSPGVWAGLFRQWHNAVMPLWLAAGVLVLAAVANRPVRRPIAFGLGAFFAAQLVFPTLYAIHEYYFYAAAAFLLAAAGSAIGAFSEGGLPRRAAPVLALICVLVNLNAYLAGFYQIQKVESVGGTGLTDAIRNTSPPDSVIIVLGNDWSSQIPYYAQRRALMIRRDLEANDSYRKRAFHDLRGEDIYALVVLYEQRGNHKLIADIAERFRLDAEVSYSFDDKADVYVSRWHRNRVLRGMGSNVHPYYNRVRLEGVPDAPPDAQQVDDIERFVHPAGREKFFSEMSPAPVRYRCAFGPNSFAMDGRKLFGAHPNSSLWFAPPAGKRLISFEFGIVPGAYQNPAGRTDGVDFSVIARAEAGTDRVVFRRRLDPFAAEGDRGLQKADVSCRLAPGEEIVFTTGFAGGEAFDWAYWGRIRIQ